MKGVVGGEGGLTTRLSHRPVAIFASVFAEQGAMRTISAQRRSSMCNIGSPIRYFGCKQARIMRKKKGGGGGGLAVGVARRPPRRTSHSSSSVQTCAPCLRISSGRKNVSDGLVAATCTDTSLYCCRALANVGAGARRRVGN
jgi:hypothetical protein